MSALSNVFSDIGNALRSKMGTVNTFYPADMAGAINNIPTGGTLDRYDFVCDYNLIAEVNITDVPNKTVQYMNLQEKTNWAVTDASCLFMNNTSDFSDFEAMYIGPSVTNADSMFQGCNYFNKPIMFYGHINSVTHLLNNCFSFGSDIFFHDTSGLYSGLLPAGSKTMGMFTIGHDSTNRRRRIWCTDAGPFLETNDTRSIIEHDITWTADPTGNGYYNTTYNIFIYNNWSPSFSFDDPF